MRYRQPAGPVLTPLTAQRLIDTFASMGMDDMPSSASQSPDSLYSETSPVFGGESSAFEYSEMLEHEEMDAEAYESLINHHDDENDGDSRRSSSSPAWGRWPHQNSLGGPGWTPLPAHTAFRSGSVISVSPRGSVSANVRRGSAPVSKLGGLEHSTNSLGLDTRRRSSAKSAGTGTGTGSGVHAISPRRRSSVMSNGSTIDPIEEERIRNFARLDVLARRFSELVEVVSPDPGESEAYGYADVAYARHMISRWSPYSTETDVSEVRTAPFAPTPQMVPPVPALLSNYPLSSVAREEYSYSLNTPEDPLEEPVFPRSPGRLPVEYTPPPVTQPSFDLRRRARPNFARAATDFTFPTRSVFGVSQTDSAEAGASIPVARPSPRRAVSTPQLPVLPSMSDPIEIPSTLVRSPSLPKSGGATGSYPLARSQPLGHSRLRESMRRASEASDTLAIPTDQRKSSIVAERRMSIVEQGSSRAFANRKMSLGTSPTREASVSPRSSRRPSLNNPRKSSASSQGSLNRTRRASSAASRKSSIVSLGEYGYLATEIDLAVPSLPSTASAPALGLVAAKGESLRSRRNAPPAIVLPPYNFPSPNTGGAGPLSSPSSATPRFNPLDSFFGRTTPGLTPSIDPLSPGLSSGSSASDMSSPKTPGLHRSVLDRGRPVASPEFQDSFPLRTGYPSQIKSPHATDDAVAKRSSSGLPRLSPSYAFPATASQPQPPKQVPLKSILVRRTADVQVPVSRAPAYPQTSHHHIDKDLEAFLRVRRDRELRETSHPTSPSVEERKTRPAMKRHSSFTRLFHRAKSQSPSTTSPSPLQ